MTYLSIIAFALLMFACYGWGYALVNWTNNRDTDNFAFLSVVGIACLIFLGGVLNLVRLAYPAALAILFLSGLGFCAMHFIANVKPRIAAWHGSTGIPEKLKCMSGNFLPIGMLIVVVGFYALTLLPVEAFNNGDDFYTYIPRPFRMLQTGTLAGNPYEVLGTDSLGAHAFLQGFVLLGFPVGYLQGLEAVFSFALAGMLLIALGKKFGLHWSYTAFALLAFIVINPQSVNVSPIYLGSAFILGIIYASCHLLDELEKSDHEAMPMISIGIMGLLTAGLLGLKNTFLVFILVYFALLFGAMLLVSKNRPRILKIFGMTVLGTVLAFSPWLALHAANYITAVQIALHPSTITSTNTFNSLQGDISALFSTADLFYGGSFLSYGVIVLLLALMGLFALYNVFGNMGATQHRGYFLVAAAACVASILTYYFNGIVVAPDVAVRYSCPVLIATLPFAFIATSMPIAGSNETASIPSQSGIKLAVMSLMTLLVVFLYWSNFFERADRAYYQHMTLAYPIRDWDLYREHQPYVISTEYRDLLRGIQYKTLPGQKILVWISVPMQLDFSRNEIYSIMSISLLNPWLDMPFNGNANDMVQYLKRQGIRYIMWEESGNNLGNTYNRWLSSQYVGYRKTAERGLFMRNVLTSLISKGNLLYDAHGIVLIDLDQVGQLGND